MAVDWLAIRNDYINGGGSYRKLAEKYGVNKDVIANRSKQEKWIEQRATQADKTKTEAIQKTQEKISEAMSDVAATKARIRAKLIRMAENWIDQQADSMSDTADYRRIVQSCVDMGVFDEDVIRFGESREDDPLTKSIKEEAERLNDANQ